MKIVNTVSTLINEIQLDGFFKIRKEIAERQKLKLYHEQNIEYYKLVLNRAKNELHKENLKVQKVSGPTKEVKIIPQSNLNIKNEMVLIKKDVDEVITYCLIIRCNLKFQIIKPTPKRSFR